MNPDGSLTGEGNRAVICIRNGALIAVGAGLSTIPPSSILPGLRVLEGPTGCGGIVNWEMAGQIGSANSILNLLRR